MVYPKTWLLGLALCLALPTGAGAQMMTDGRYAVSTQTFAAGTGRTVDPGRVNWMTTSTWLGATE